jgi:hypothetical protein
MGPKASRRCQLSNAGRSPSFELAEAVPFILSEKSGLARSTMGVCPICGKAAGFLRSKHAECESTDAVAPPLIAVVNERPLTTIRSNVSAMAAKLKSARFDPMTRTTCSPRSAALERNRCSAASSS